MTQDADHAPPSPLKGRSPRVKVSLTGDDLAEIQRLADLAGMSVSGYLRAAGLNAPIRSTLDYAAVRELAKVAGDLGRLGGLLKLWLSEQRDRGASAIDVDAVLREARALQDAIRQRIGKL
ncbi:MAG: conjugal transfer protein TraJ [Burkholderiales bacterium]|nr:conjugal transfer protein TraJ [Burkholderiales bacterium]